MSRERLFLTFILALVGLAVFGLLRPSSPDPQEDVQTRASQLYTTKAFQTNRFDGVIVGDSRALRALSPAEISRSLPGVDFYNFAWNAGGMNEEMYTEAEELLDSESPNPMIILAPTALSLMPIKRANSQFHEYRRKPWDQVMVYRHAPAVASWFQSLSPSVYPRKILGILPHLMVFQTFHDDGWIETDQTPHDDLEDLSLLRARLGTSKVDQDLVSELMDRTAAWAARGIRVFALSVPAHPPRVALEDSLLEFDTAGFIDSFTAAGGIWIDIPQTGFDSYDGSHLVARSAREVSALVGQAIARTLAGDGQQAAGP